VCNHYNRAKVGDVEAFEKAISDAVEKILAGIPPETWGWSKDRMPVVYQGAQGRTLTTMRWGVWPYYQKTLKGRPVVNARDDALLTKNIWKYSVKERRCVAAADGFFEWTGPEGAKWEVQFTLPEQRPFFFGAIWSDDPVGDERGFSIVTTKPNPIVAGIGHDRTPLILDAEGAKRWIGSEPMPDDELMAFCQPYAGEFVRRDLPAPDKKKKIAKSDLKPGQEDLLLG
jgi:putative SOS response-associated peptidase YedK